MLRTRVTELLGIEHPIIGGGMQWLSRAELVAAISNAGGLGVLVSAPFSDPEGLREEIRRTRQLTDKPFGVNLSLFPSTRPLPNQGFAQVCAEERVALVETSGTRPPSEEAPILKAAGVKLMHKCTSARHALSAQDVGADMVAVVGYEAGGAIGRSYIASSVLTPRTVDMVDVPVLAAGGIADGRGLVAALSWGAEGVVIGTRFMASQECWAHPALKQALLRAQEADTVILERNLGNDHRMLNTELAQRVWEMEEKGAGLEELLPYISGLSARRMLETGDLDAGVVSCGQAVGFIHDLPTVKEVVDRIMAQAEETMARLGQLQWARV